MNAKKDSKGEIKSDPLTRMYPSLNQEISNEIIALGLNL